MAAFHIYVVFCFFYQIHNHVSVRNTDLGFSEIKKFNLFCKFNNLGFFEMKKLNFRNSKLEKKEKLILL